MSDYEHAKQDVLDLNAIILDPNQDDPSDEVIYEAVQRLHKTLGTAVAAKKAAVPTIDLATLVAEEPEKPDAEAKS